MSQDNRRVDELLDRAVRELRETPPDTARAKRAASHVWAGLMRQQVGSPGPDSATTLRSCGDFRLLIPSYVAGSLSEGRALLLEDHTRGCPSCRSTIVAARSGTGTANEPDGAAARAAARSRRWPIPRWAVAAAVIVGTGLVAAQMTQGYLPDPFGMSAAVPVVDGDLYRIEANGNALLNTGDRLRQGQVVRTARGAGAVLELDDGSRVELAERSEVSFYGGWRNATVELIRGRIIVQAAERSAGHLYVKTGDCRIAVKGTVFSVAHGTKGSRVSVLEGEVHVQQGRNTRVLLAGDQATTHESMGTVPLALEIAWSRNVNEHLQLMRELIDLGRELERVPRPGLRYETRLAKLVPRDTTIYIAIPNLTGTVGESYELIRQRVAASQTLSRWWQESIVDTGAEPEIERAIAAVRDLGERLGDEIVVAIGEPAASREPKLLILAELVDEQGFAELVERELNGPNADGVALVSGARPAMPGGAELAIWIHDGLLAISPQLGTLEALSAARAADGSGFERSPIAERIAAGYRNGAGWLIAADLRAILDSADRDTSREATAALEGLGLMDANALLIERKRVGDQTINEATVSFNGPRRGIAAWIAEPSPMGAIEYVSPEAHFAVGFVVSDPARLVKDLFERLDAGDSGFMTELERFETESGLSVIEDIAAPLGGEFAFALDGPVLPNPAWRLIVEVYDEARLQRTLEWAVDRVNERLTADGLQEIAFERADAGGRVEYALRVPGSPTELHYTYAGGYLIAAPQAVLLDRAIQTRASGYSLTSASAFRELLPADGPDNFSAFVYQRLGALLSPLAGTLGSAGLDLTPAQTATLDELARESRPSLIYAYGHGDSIVIANTGFDPFTGSMGGLFPLASLTRFDQTIGEVFGAAAEAAAQLE